MHLLIKMRQQRLHILVMCHSLHIRLSTCNSYFMQNCFSLLLERGRCVSSTPGTGWNIKKKTCWYSCDKCLLMWQYSCDYFHKVVVCSEIRGHMDAYYCTSVGSFSFIVVSVTFKHSHFYLHVPSYTFWTDSNLSKSLVLFYAFATTYNQHCLRFHFCQSL